MDELVNAIRKMFGTDKQKRVEIAIDNEHNAKAIMNALFDDGLCVEVYKWDNRWYISFYAEIVVAEQEALDD